MSNWKNTWEIEKSFNKNRRHLLTRSILHVKSLFINFSLLSRLAHSHTVSVGSRLASVDPFSTSFLLRWQVISEVGRIFHLGDSYRCVHHVKATASVLITSDAVFDLSRTSATPRSVSKAFQDRALLGLWCELEWSYDMEIRGETLPIIKERENAFGLKSGSEAQFQYRTNASRRCSNNFRNPACWEPNRATSPELACCFIPQVGDERSGCVKINGFVFISIGAFWGVFNLFIYLFTYLSDP